jgi:hypothetical protein
MCTHVVSFDINYVITNFFGCVSLKMTLCLRRVRNTLIDLFNECKYLIFFDSLFTVPMYLVFNKCSKCRPPLFSYRNRGTSCVFKVGTF